MFAPARNIVKQLRSLRHGRQIDRARSACELHDRERQVALQAIHALGVRSVQGFVHPLGVVACQALVLDAAAPSGIGAAPNAVLLCIYQGAESRYRVVRDGA